MRRQFVPFAAAAMVIGTAASADPFVDAVVKNFQDMGYQYVEIERGLTQLKAEGVRGNEELEVVYDLATGRILKQESGRADAEYIGRTGVEIDSRARDFVGDDDDDDDSDDDDSDDDNDDDDDDNSGSGSGRDDDDDDDNSGSGSGNDDDDDNSGSGGGGDDDDDNSGGGGGGGGGGDDSDDDDDDD